MSTPANPPLSIRASLAFPPGADMGAIMAAMALPSERMATAISLGLKQLAFKAQKERFTGKGSFPVSQRKLGNVSGRLKRDIHAEPAMMITNGYRGRIGAKVEYFGAHEVGFSGTVSIRAHQRKPHTIKSRMMSRLEQTVRAHSKMMKIPARKPLATAIEEHADKILGTQISKAARAAMKR